MVEWEKARPQYFNIPSLGDSLPARTDDYPRNWTSKVRTRKVHPWHGSLGENSYVREQRPLQRKVMQRLAA